MYYIYLRSLARTAVLVDADNASVATIGAKGMLSRVAVTLANGALTTDMDAVGARALAQLAGLLSN